MTELLLRVFVKDYQQGVSTDVHASIGKLAGMVGIVCNIILFAGKLAAGLLSGAISIVADAMNNLMDASSSVITLIGFHMAQRPADQKHPYGYARYEYVSGFVVAMLILLVGVELGKSSVERIFNPGEVDFSAVPLIIMIVSVAVKLWMSVFFRSLGKKINSATLAATSADSRNDAISTMAVLAGGLVSIFFHVSIDGWVGLVVALFILWSGIGIAKDTISPIIGHGADEDLIEKLEQSLLIHDRILGVYDLMVHDYGPGRYYASVYMEFSAEEDPQKVRDLINYIEHDILREFGIHLAIHYAPVPVNDAEYDEMREIVRSVIAEMNPAFSMHGFHITRTRSGSRLTFGLDVPYSMLNRQQELEQQIASALRERGKDYRLSVRLAGKK